MSCSGGIGFLLRNYISDTAVGRLVNLDRRPRYRYRGRQYYKNESVYSDLDGNRTGCEWRESNFRSKNSASEISRNFCINVGLRNC